MESGGDVESVLAVLDSGIDLGKLWDAAQVLIGGSLEVSEPLMTGVPVGEDLGFGPAMFASPVDVARVAAGLVGLYRDAAGRGDWIIAAIT